MQEQNLMNISKKNIFSKETMHNMSLLINLASTTTLLVAQKTVRSRILGSRFNYSIGLGESFESHPKI